MRVPALLTSPALSDVQRWQLVASLYDQVGSHIEGTLTILVALAICAVATGGSGFWAIGGLTILVTLLRALHWRHFAAARRNIAHATRTPEAWARDFTIGISATAGIWGLTITTITFGFHDMQLLLVTIIMAHAWLAGAGVRNAASPSALLGQTLVILLPVIICTLAATSPLVRVLAPGTVFFALGLHKIARFYGTQMLTIMESEQRLAAANQELLSLSRTDGLTGIANRRAFDEALQASWALAVRQGFDLAIVMIDVDHFKRFNDLYGHPAGDECLRTIAALLNQAALRASDLAARYGGEEFVLLLPSTSAQDAAIIAETLRCAVIQANLPHHDGPLGRVTISLGIASIGPTLNDHPQNLVAAADNALYRAKQNGRNQCQIALPCPATLAKTAAAGGRTREKPGSFTLT